MLEVFLDQMTFVALPEEAVRMVEWPVVAERMVGDLLVMSHLDRVMGAPSPGSTPSGYTKGVCWNGGTGMASIAYNPMAPTLGVIVQLSARALATWRRTTGGQVPDLLRLCDCPGRWRVRVSRIDLDADYINEPTVETPTEVYDQLVNEQLMCCYRKTTKCGKESWVRRTTSARAFSVNGRVGTLYLGRNAKGAGATMRLYDKKTEQIEQNGPYRQRALDVDSWVRHEVVLLHHMAHASTEPLLNIWDEAVLAGFIADSITARFAFFQTEEGRRSTPHPLTAMLMERGGVGVAPPPNRDCPSLADSYRNVRDLSGLCSLLAKTREIWGDDAPRQVLDQLGDEFEQGYKLTDSVRHWVRNESGTARETWPAVDQFLEAVRKRKTSIACLPNAQLSI